MPPVARMLPEGILEIGEATSYSNPPADIFKDLVRLAIKHQFDLGIKD